ncbi:MAG: hypothetical protein ACR2NU_14155, partial [Aeoliella sp.]
MTQGYMLASERRLYVPAGKLAPSVYNRRTGKFLSSVNAPRGAFALISDNVLFAGPSVEGGTLGAVAEEAANDQLASFPGNEMIVSGDVIYLLTDDKLSAVSRRPLEVQKLDKRKGQLEAELETTAEDAERTPLQEELDDVQKRLT